MFTIPGKVAIVTGCGGKGGIGEAIAIAFAKAGVNVFGIDIKGLDEMKEKIEGYGVKFEYMTANLCKPSTDLMKEIVETAAAKMGSVDILVNNAGISIEQPLNDMSIETWKQIIDTNLNSVAVVTKAFLPMMIRQNSGNIVNVSSGAGLRGLPGSCAYSASKAGVICLSQALGDEVRRYGIRVNVICPGPIDTELFQLSERREYLLKNGGDVFSPESVASSILFLASDMSGGINSQILTMRGVNRW